MSSLAWRLPGRKQELLSDAVNGVSLEDLAEAFQESRGNPRETRQNKKFQRRLAAHTRKRLKAAQQEYFQRVEGPKDRTPEALMAFEARHWGGFARREFYTPARAAILADHLGAMAARYNEQLSRPGLTRLEAARDAMRESAALSLRAAEEKAGGYGSLALGQMLGGRRAVEVERNARNSGRSTPDEGIALLAEGALARANEADARRVVYDNDAASDAFGFERLAGNHLRNLDAPLDWGSERDTTAVAAAHGTVLAQVRQAVPWALAPGTGGEGRMDGQAVNAAAQGADVSAAREATAVALRGTLRRDSPDAAGRTPDADKRVASPRKDHEAGKAAAANTALGLPTYLGRVLLEPSAAKLLDKGMR